MLNERKIILAQNVIDYIRDSSIHSSLPYKIESLLVTYELNNFFFIRHAMTLCSIAYRIYMYTNSVPSNTSTTNTDSCISDLVYPETLSWQGYFNTRFIFRIFV